MDSKTRLSDVLSYRISSEMRLFLEGYARQNNIGLGEAARTLVSAGIVAKGLNRENIEASHEWRKTRRQG